MPALVGVTDTNALAARACNAASHGHREDLFCGLARTGRSNTYVSAHVPGELGDHLAEVVANCPGLALADAQQVLWGQIMPGVPVVDLAVGDYLHPQVRPTLSCRGACAAMLMTRVPQQWRNSWPRRSSSVPTACSPGSE